MLFPCLPLRRAPWVTLPRIAALSGVVLGSLALTQGAAVPSTTPGVPASLPATTATRLAGLLPGTGQVVQIMQLGSRLTAVDLQNRVLEVGGSREALQAVLAVIARGGMPVYDERLGISKAEFGKYLAFQPLLIPTGKTVKLPVTRDASRVTFLDSPALSVLRGLSFDLRTGEVRIPEGFTIKPVSITPSSAPDRTLDIKQAFIWNMKAYNASTQNGVSGQLWLYHLTSGQVVIGYKRMSMIKGIPNDGDLMISYQR
ncbi:hypothetical protein [Deinococcus fonticola]|uniref:hypothetical protein n=1 Tax=Deinococcus fonticola TaxID=2528713 RepID=UPI001F0D195F|nr:hypothetical protein [Deinococcus fonticola]